jgi:hypothetical protein
MLARVEGSLQGLPLDGTGWGGPVLCQLLQQARTMETLPTSMVRPMLFAS